MNRRRTSLLSSLAFAVAVWATASAAFAQRGGPPGGGPPGGGPPGGGPPGGGPPGGFGFGFGGPPGGFGGRGGFGGEPGSHLLTLTEDSAVWDEIKITDEQLGKVIRLRKSVNKASRSFRNNLRAAQQAESEQQRAAGQVLDQAARDAARQAQRDAERAATAQNSATLEAESESALRKILKPAQFSRVQQIDLQEAGPLVVARPDVAKALNLTAEQLDKIQVAFDQMRQGQDQVDQSRRQFFDSMRNRNNNNNGGGRRGGNNNNTQMSDADREAQRLQFQQSMQKFQADSDTVKSTAIAAISKILSKTQKNKFNAMLGKAFDVSKLNDGRGPNNPFNPARNRGRGGPGGGGPGGGGTQTGGTPAVASSTGIATPGGTATNGNSAQTKATLKTQTKGATSKTGTGTAR